MKPSMNNTKVMCLGFALLVSGLSWSPQAEAGTIESFYGEGSDVSYLFNLFTQSLVQNARPASVKQGPAMGNADSSVKTTRFVGIDRVRLPLRRSAGELVFLTSGASVFHDFASGGEKLVFPGNPKGHDHPLPPVGEMNYSYAVETFRTDRMETDPGMAFGLQGVVQSIKKTVATTLAVPAEGHLLEGSRTTKGALPSELDTRVLLGEMNAADGPGTRYGYTLDGAAFWRKLLGNPDRKQIWPEGASQGTGPSTVALLGSGLAAALIWRMKKAQA